MSVTRNVHLGGGVFFFIRISSADNSIEKLLEKNKDDLLETLRPTIARVFDIVRAEAARQETLELEFDDDKV